MILRRLADAITGQNWFTVVLEVLIVVVGIFIGLQVDAWNEARKDRADIAVYLERIHQDLERDVTFFTFLTDQAEGKRGALATLKEMIRADGAPEEDAGTVFDLAADSLTIGFEFPEVRTVTFFDLQSSGKLALIEDAGLRRQLSFYYQESLHRSDRIESRITGYAAALYEMVEPGARLVARDNAVRGEISWADNENFDPNAAVENFLAGARKERFLSLLTAEQNYTEFMIVQLNIQMEEIGALRQAVADAIGGTDP